MIILCKRNVVIPSADGMMHKFIPRDYIGKVDEWVRQSDYYKDLVADGKIVESNTTKDKDLDKAAEQAVIDNAQEQLKAEEEAEKPKRKVSKK